MDIDTLYDSIEYDDLTEEEQTSFNELNLESLLKKQLDSIEIDIPMTRFLINRLGQLNRTEPLPRLLIETEMLYPVLNEIILYLARLTEKIPANDRQDIGSLLIGKLNDSAVGHLEFHRMLVLSLFAGSNKWGNFDKLANLYNSFPDPWSRRALLLGFGRSAQDFWLREKKNSFDQFPPWEKRAFIYASSCLPKDEMKHYHKAIKPKLDELEKYVMRWSADNPIS